MYYGKFHEADLRSIKASGHLLDALQRQNSGIGSHFQSQGYPFNTPMWNGGVGKVILASTICHDNSVETPMHESWWPYEQSAYLLDGLLRLGILLNDRSKIDLFRKNLDWLIQHPDSGGLLGHCYNDSPSEWPLAVFFRAAQAYCGITSDRTAEKAFHRHFSALSVEQLAVGFRHINNLEGLLKTGEWTGDEALLKKAVQAYLRHDERNRMRTDDEFELNWSKLTSGRNFVIHGVSFSESVKLPVLLHLYTGERKWLDGAEQGLADVLERHEQIPGLPSSNENFSGRDPLQGYETCLISDFTWALGYFLMATGKAEYADRIEKIIYNALPGSVLPDFSALQYLSSPNQVIASEMSNHSFFFRGMSNFRQYRPDHSAQCCTGNIHRALPNFVLRSWMLDHQHAPAAAFYAPSVFSGSFQGTDYTLTEETEYPEDGVVRFHFHAGKRIEMPFTFRIPSWCHSAEVRFNGHLLSLPLAAGSYQTVKPEWKDGDTLEVNLSMTPVQKHDRYWSWFECGPTVFSYPVANREEKMGDGRFVPREFYPASRWNYGVAEQKTIRRGRDADGHSFLEIDAFPVTGFDALEQGRFTPEIPLFCAQNGPAEKLILRPYGETRLRITAFPDAMPRKILPVYQVLTSQTYPYDFRKALSEQHFLPEYRSEKENLAAASEVQADHSGYYDLIHHFGPSKDVLAYLYFRIWSEDAGEATFAVSAADGAECYVNGVLYHTVEPPSDGEFMAPACFRAPIRKAYNLLMLKVCEGMAPFQYRRAWGARAQAFISG